MSSSEIDDYLAALDEPARTTLGALRTSVLAVVPDAEQCISYAMPAFRVHGKVVAGFAAFRRHLAYLPHSSTVFPAIAGDLAGYTYTKGSLHFPLDTPLPDHVVRLLVETRLDEIGAS